MRQLRYIAWVGLALKSSCSRFLEEAWHEAPLSSHAARNDLRPLDIACLGLVAVRCQWAKQRAGDFAAFSHRKGVQKRFEGDRDIHGQEISGSLSPSW